MVTDTHGEKIARHLDSFTDRERILTRFNRLLHESQPGEFYLLAVKGNSGTGKTFLIEYLSKRICPPAGWQTGVLAFTQSFPDFRTILDNIEDALKGCVPRQSLTQYRVQREEYTRRFDEYRASIIVKQDVGATDSSSIANIQMNAHVNAELRRRELQLRAETTRALLELAEESAHPLCLFIDGYERLVETDPELVGWLWEEVLLKLPKRAPRPILVVACGWEYPMSAALQPFSTNDELDDFDLERVQSYLQTQSIISSPIVPTQAALVSAFYELTRGHPLVLALAVTYVQTLPEPERTVENLRAQQPLLDEEARVQWLEERLLRRLPEPYRTLLERGPILRSLNQATLQALLQAEPNGTSNETVFDDRSYIRFLEYPFINRKNAQGNALLEQPTFHVLTRRVRLKALRRWHPETWQFLHLTMAEYYLKIIEAEQQKTTIPQAKQPENDFTEWFAEIPEQEFRALLGYLYHALQIKEVQEKAFEYWYILVSRAVDRWRRKQAGPLLEIVQQIVEVEEPFFNKDSDSYGQYLMWYSRFLEQEARWDDAHVALQEAMVKFEQSGNLLDQATCFNNIGSIYDSRGLLDEALDYHQRSLSLYEQAHNISNIALSLNNIGAIYRQQGRLDEALDYFQRSLSLYEQVGDPSDIARARNNIGEIYRRQRLLDEALSYHQRSLSLNEQVGDPSAIAGSLNNIGAIYDSWGLLDKALNYYQRSLSLNEQVGDPSTIASSLNNIGAIYDSWGLLDKALNYYQRSLSLNEQVGDPSAIAGSLNNIGFIYRLRGLLDKALDYYQSSLSLNEQVRNPSDIALSLHNVGGVYYLQDKWQDALPFFSRSLSLYEQMGRGFESHIADELEMIVACCVKRGEIEQAAPYYKRAQKIREQLQKKKEAE